MAYSNNSFDVYEVTFFVRSNPIKQLIKEKHKNGLPRILDKTFRLNLIRHYNKINCRVVSIVKNPDQPVASQ